MKRFVFLLVCMLYVSLSALSADSALGYWKSIDDETGKVTAGWEIYVKNGILYGRIITAVDVDSDDLAIECIGPYDDFPLPGDTSKMTIVGTPWIYNLKNVSQGVWKGGRIIDPANGKDYACEITFHKAGGKYKVDTLEMRGKIGPFGRSQYWQRASLEEILAL